MNIKIILSYWFQMPFFSSIFPLNLCVWVGQREEIKEKNGKKSGRDGGDGKIKWKGYRKKAGEGGKKRKEVEMKDS